MNKVIIVYFHNFKIKEKFPNLYFSKYNKN